jgi:hypothetical protein
MQCVLAQGDDTNIIISIAVTGSKKAHPNLLVEVCLEET